LQKCITCGAALHPERAAKYAYCMSPECQEKNARGLTMVAVGVNKAAEQAFRDNRRKRTWPAASITTSGEGHSGHRQLPLPLLPRLRGRRNRQPPSHRGVPSRRAAPLSARRASPGASSSKGSRCFTTNKGSGLMR
jgi:hypothetical protein